MKECTIKGTLRRNLSSSWYYDMPSLCIDLSLPEVKVCVKTNNMLLMLFYLVVKVNVSSSIVKVVADIVFGNFSENSTKESQQNINKKGN